MSDLVDRQAVIDLLKQMRKDGDMVPWEGKAVFARIRKLPTIQPEKAQLSQEGTTKDTISRQAALDIFDDYNISVENGELEAYRDVFEIDADYVSHEKLKRRANEVP